MMKKTEKATDNSKSEISKYIETNECNSQLSYIENIIQENASTSNTEIVPITIRCADTKSLLEYSDEIYNPRSTIKDNTIDENNVFENHLDTLLENKDIEMIPFNASTNVKPSTMVLKEKISFYEIEYLYNKYFSRSFNDTIIIISNILSIILSSNKYHKSQMDELFGKTDIKKIRSETNLQHLKYKIVLEAKLKNLVKDLLSSFDDAEFEIMIKMVFLNILKIFKILDQHKLNKTNLFKNLVLLLWKSLENSKFKHHTFYLTLKCKLFYSECNDISCLIKDNRNTNLDITNYIWSYCRFILNTQEYFKTIIDAVTSRSNVDLALLIDSCTLEYHKETLVKYQKNDYSSIQNCVIDKISLIDIQKALKENKRVKLYMKAPPNNETYQ